MLDLCIAFMSLNPFDVNLQMSYLEFFQYFIRFPSVLAKVFHLFALGTASIVLHFGALGVQFRALGLVAHGPVLCAHARAVRVSRVEALPQFVHKAAVVHAAFAPVVVEDHVVGGGALSLVRGVILRVPHGGRRRHAHQGQEEDGGGREVRAHPSPRHHNIHIQHKRVDDIFFPKLRISSADPSSSLLSAPPSSSSSSSSCMVCSRSGNRINDTMQDKSTADV